MNLLPFESSDHARRRIPQRGVRNDRIELLLQYGRCYHAGNGAFAFWLCSRAVEEARSRFGLRLESHADWVVIVSADGMIITVYKANRRQRHWRPSGRGA